MVATQIVTARNLFQLQQNGLERPAQEGESPVSEQVGNLLVEDPKYCELRGSSRESRRTTS
jgi:hypothetical protein